MDQPTTAASSFALGVTYIALDIESAGLYDREEKTKLRGRLHAPLVLNLSQNTVRGAR